MIELPIEPHLPRIAETIGACRTAVIVAPPGSGKSTRVPPALLGAGRLLLLQPRRAAARALARRIADEQRWKLGEEIGWQIRFDSNFTNRSRLVVATEGILNARLRDDPLIEAFDTIVLDEFHERSVHSDLGLALLKQARAARPELGVVVMSATMDPEPVSAFLGGAPIIEVPARTHPLQIKYQPDSDVVDVALKQLQSTTGDILIFLPGAADIERLHRALLRRVSPDISIHRLFGGLDAREQDAALRPSTRRKVILATNIAETSLTVEGVSQVIDTGFHKVARLSASLGLDRLELERIPMDSADQRAGRAGRTGPGTALRLWDSRDVLRPAREAEIHRIDLSGPFLNVLAWGEDPRSFDWFDTPDVQRSERAWALLEALGAVHKGQITPLGRAMVQLPLAPRLARIVLAAPHHRRLVEGCVAVAEGQLFRRDPRNASQTSTENDLLSQLDQLPPNSLRGLQQVRKRLASMDHLPAWQIDSTASDEEVLARAFLLGFPDRVGFRRVDKGHELLMCDGFGATLSPASGVQRGRWILALDIQAAALGTQRQAIVHAAARIERDWLVPTATQVAHQIDLKTGRVGAIEQQLYRKLTLRSNDAPLDPEHAAQMLCDALLERGLSSRLEQLKTRMEFAGIALNLRQRLQPLCYERKGWFEPDLLATLSWPERQRLDQYAPETLPIPSGRSIRLDYRSADSVFAAVKLQELFGLKETPRVGANDIAVTFELLAPNGRPVQTTTDLNSFWNTTYPEVRKELRGRYPKHPWPEDPWSATPTRYTKRRMS